MVWFDQTVSPSAAAPHAARDGTSHSAAQINRCSDAVFSPYSTCYADQHAEAMVDSREMSLAVC